MPPRDCGDLKGGSGVYTISPFGEKCGFDVYCDMDTDGGGWTVRNTQRVGSLYIYKYKDVPLERVKHFLFEI